MKRQAEEKKYEPEVGADLEVFVVNLVESGPARYFRTTLSVGIKSKKEEEEVKESRGLTRHVVYQVPFGSWRVASKYWNFATRAAIVLGFGVVYDETLVLGITPYSMTTLTKARDHASWTNAAIADL